MVGYSRPVLTLVLIAVSLTTILITGCGTTGAYPSSAGTPSSQLATSATALDFGNTTVGTPSTKSLNLTAHGSASVVISQVSTTGTAFTVSGASLPLTLAAGASANLTVTANPQTAGTISETLSVISNASNSPTSVALTTTASAPAAAVTTLNPTSLNFGSVTVGSSSAKSVVISNSGGVSMTISQITSSGTGYTVSGFSLPIVLTAGASTSFNVNFAPTTTGNASGSVSLTGNGSNSPVNLPLTGSGAAAPVAQLTANPATGNFGNVTVGSSSSQSISVTNSGTISVTISQIVTSGAAFSLAGVNVPLTLNPGQSSTYIAQFSPTAVGSSSGQISFTSNASNSPTLISLSGTGVAAPTPQLSVNATSLSFGSVTVGSSGTKSITISNSGNADLTISQITTSGNGFGGSGVTLPLTLTPGQTASYTAQFAPTTTGSVSGQISFNSNSPTNPAVSLSGTGVAAPTAQLSVNPASLSFGSVTVGNSGTQSITISNSGSANLTISQITTSGTGFTGSGVSLPLTLAPGQTAIYTGQFAPSATGSASGQISFNSNSPTNPSVSLTGTGVAAPVLQLSVSQSSLAFGSVTVGSSASQSVVLTNTGNASVTISQVTITGTGFTGSGIPTPLTLTPGQTASYTSQFAPTATGSASGQITFTSNATNSPTTVSLGGTGVAATVLQLTANPTSINFGNVNVGSTATQSVAITNTGNANVTISQITPSGSGFSGSGITVPLTLAAGQSANYTAQFAPAVAGSPTGQVSFTSNATNSPTIVSLSGTGVTTTSGPLCGKLNDGLVHLPTNYDTFTPPAAGQSYVDSVFGCTVQRVTNGSAETLGDGTHPGLMNFYSTLTALNASDNMLFVVATDGNWSIRDTSGNVIISTSKMPNFSGHPVWDATNGNVFYYALSNSVFSGTISGTSLTATSLHTFTEYSAVTSMDMADLSQDGDHMALIGQNSNGTMDIFVWSFSQKTKTSVYTTTCTGTVAGAGQPGCLHKLQLSPDNRLTIQFAPEGSGAEQGVRLWTGSSLVHMQDVNTNHYDTGSDLNGNPIFASVDNSTILSSVTSPCASGWGLDVRLLNNVKSAICLLDNQPYWHISYRGSASQPWIALSFFDSRTPGPEFFSSDGNYQTISASNWQLYEDEIILAKVDASKIYRLAHARSRSMESYWAQPHAAISRDGKYVIFTSDMAHPNGCPANMHVANDCSDVYLIQIQ
jgi:hypothetical protein